MPSCFNCGHDVAPHFVDNKERPCNEPDCGCPEYAASVELVMNVSQGLRLFALVRQAVTAAERTVEIEEYRRLRNPGRRIGSLTRAKNRLEENRALLDLVQRGLEGDAS